MTLVSTTELKAHLAEHLHRAQRGERIQITAHGKEVAELGPPNPERAAMWTMVQAGEAEWSGASATLPDKLPANKGPLLSDMVFEDRGPYPEESG